MKELSLERMSRKWTVMPAKYAGRCRRCDKDFAVGDMIQYHPKLKTKCPPGTACDAGAYDDEGSEYDEDADAQPRTSTKADKEDFEHFSTQMEAMQEQVQEAKDQAAKAEERADDAANAARDAEDRVEKARRIEVVKTLPSGAKKVKKLGPQHANFPLLLSLVQAGVNVAMIGDAGSGKTHAPLEIAKALGLELYTVPLGPMTSKSDMIGFISGMGKYVFSLACRGYEQGGVILLDEMDASNPAGLTIMNGMLDAIRAGFADKMRDRHPDCHFVAAMNTHGKGADTEYVGRAQLDLATLSRWYKIEWNTDWELTRALVPDKKWVDRLQALSKSAQRQGIKGTIIGMRTARLGYAAMTKAGKTMEEAEEGLIWFGMKPDDKQKILAGLPQEPAVEGDESNG